MIAVAGVSLIAILTACSKDDYRYSDNNSGATDQASTAALSIDGSEWDSDGNTTVANFVNNVLISSSSERDDDGRNRRFVFSGGNAYEIVSDGQGGEDTTRSYRYSLQGNTAVLVSYDSESTREDDEGADDSRSTSFNLSFSNNTMTMVERTSDDSNSSTNIDLSNMLNFTQRTTSFNRTR